VRTGSTGLRRGSLSGDSQLVGSVIERGGRELLTGIGDHDTARASITAARKQDDVAGEGGARIENLDPVALASARGPICPSDRWRSRGSHRHSVIRISRSREPAPSSPGAMSAASHACRPLNTGRTAKAPEITCLRGSFRIYGVACTRGTLNSNAAGPRLTRAARM